MLDNLTKGRLRVLIYPIQFNANPIDNVDWVLAMTFREDGEGKRGEYLAAIRTGLESSESLAALIPQDHSEAVIRDYLGEVARRIL